MFRPTARSLLTICTATSAIALIVLLATQSSLVNEAIAERIASSAKSALSPKFEKTPNGGQKVQRWEPSQSLILNSVPYGGFCVLFDFWEMSAEFREGDHITLVLHSTPEYLGYLGEHVANWGGGISVAMFVAAPRLSPNGTVGIPLQLRTEYGDLQSPNDGVYPINAARNIGRRGVRTKLFLSGDIENYFCRNYEQRALQLAKEYALDQSKQMVIVHRRFEIEDSAPVPRNKTELRTLYDAKRAVIFHAKFFVAGHKIPHLTEWFDHPENPANASAQMIIPYNMRHWEPQFVGDSRVPLHDETFPFRFRTNQQLGYHMCRMGYQFLIANDLFTVHRGIKRHFSAGERLALITQHRHYSRISRDFKRRMNLLYPQTRYSCPR